MKICIKTLGCKVNAYESEYIRLQAEKKGFEIVDSDADVYIVNTCTVTNNSDAKSKKIIRKIRRENRNSICGQSRILGTSLFFRSLCHAQCHTQVIILLLTNICAVLHRS